MTYHLKNFREGFPFGLTEITNMHEKNLNTGITFSILKVKKGETKSIRTQNELALLHMDGETRVVVNGKAYKNKRESLFDEQPFCVHTSCGTELKIHAITDCEYALFETENKKSFPNAVYSSDTGADEHRGKGLVGDTSLRFVRTIFDGSNSHPSTQLVLGEVVNFPGRWSSYPPHHHVQPEIYHYRFTDPRGFGHAELGEDVYRIRQYDSLKILDELDHAQCSAPGYGMYYIWVIRHLEDARYSVPEFTQEHRWTMEKGAAVWQPKEKVHS